MTKEEIIDALVHMLIELDSTWEFEYVESGVLLENSAGHIISAPSLESAVRAAIALYNRGVWE